MSESTSGFQRGDSLGRYLVLDTLGRGGMGVVLRAFDPELDRAVAIKVVVPEDRDDAVSRKRLLREGQAMARLSHPNVVTVHDVGVAQAGVFIAMELVAGADLDQWLAKKRPLSDVLEVFIQCARALTAAHETGLVHGDFKPANVLVAADGTAKVSDFGLARPAITDRGTSVLERDRLALGADPGTGGGTHGFVAPECAAGKRGDARSDQYSFCAALREALASTTAGAVDRDSGSALPATLPFRLRRLLRRGLCADPADRFDSMAAIERQLDLIRRRRSILVRRCAMATLVGLGVAGALYTSDAADPCAPFPWEEAGWTSERRTALEDAISASGVPEAERTSSRVTTAFDHHTELLLRGRRLACEASVIVGDQSPELYDARVLCYERAWTRFEAVLNVLLDSKDVLSQLDDPTAPLLDPEVCGGRAALLLQLPSPPDEDTGRDVRRLRSSLALAKATLWSGDLDAARQQAQAIHTEAQSLGFAPLQAETALQLGLVASESGEWSTADELLASAFWLAEGTRHDRIAVESATAMSQVVGVKLVDYARGLEWNNHARAALQRYGRGDEAEIDVENARAALLLSHGQADDALSRYRRVLDLLDDSVGGPRSPLQSASAREHAAVALESVGRFREAKAYYAQALREMEAEFGPVHPRVGQLLHNIAIFHHSTGDFRLALSTARRALAVKDGVYEDPHPSVAMTLQVTGVALLELGETDAALEDLRRGTAIVEHTLGPAHPEMGVALANLAAATAHAQRHDEAGRLYSESLSILTAHFGADHPLLAEVHQHRSRLLRAQGDLRGARDALELSVSLLDGSRDAGPTWGHAKVELAALLRELGEPEHARKAASDGQAVLEKLLPPTHPLLAQARLVTGRTRLAAADRDAAIEQFALAYMAMAPRPDFPKARAEAAAAWARGLWADAQPEAARAIIAWARADLETRGEQAAAAEVLDGWRADQ